MNLQTLPLAAITRISPANPRHGEIAADAADVSQLAATIKAAGLKYPLLVMPRADAEGEFEVIDGGRRWRALKTIFSDAEEIAVEIHAGDEASARLAGLAVSITPRALHPVDEFEAFADMVEAGLDVAAIAQSFALTERHVKQRLALGSLAPCVRDAWRKGEISRDSAEAFTIGALAAQEALFESWQGTNYAARLQSPYEIRKNLRGEALDAATPLARFFGADESRLARYLEAGGRLADDLFSEGPALLDPPLAQKIAQELLLAQAQEIADAEGWGLAFGHVYAAPRSFLDVDRADAIGEEIHDLCVAVASAEGPELEALARQLEEKTRAAFDAAYPADERAGFGVAAVMGFDGAVTIERGVAPIAAAAPAAPPAAQSASPAGAPEEEEAGDSGDGAAAPASPAPKGPFDEPSKALRPLIEATVADALCDVVSRRVDLALVYCVAALGCAYGQFGVRLQSVAYPCDADNELIDAISVESFQDALALCAQASTNDLSAAFARLIGLSFGCTGATMPAMTALLAAAAIRGANLPKAFDRALDARGFFEAMPKKDALKIVGALIGDGEAKRVKGYDRDKLADYLAKLASDKGFLPSPFGDWAALAVRDDLAGEAMPVEAVAPSLAEEMVKAIEADAAGESGEVLTPPPKPARRPRKSAGDKSQASRAKKGQSNAQD